MKIKDIVDMKGCYSAKDVGEKEIAIVTVCNACLSEACWKGEMYCENYKEAGTEEVIREVKK